MSLTIGHLNVRSLGTGFDVLSENVIRDNYDILAISETWLVESISSDKFNINGYKLVRMDRVERGGGVAFYIKCSLQFNQIIISDSSSVDLEQLWVQVVINGRKHAFGVIYRPPCGNILEAVKMLDNSLSLIVSENDEVLIAGDVNVNMLNTEQNATIIINNMLESYGLSLINNEPTRISGNSSTLIDVIVYSNPEKVGEIGSSDLNISDHLLVFCKLDVQKSKHEPNIITYRDLNNLNCEALMTDLRKICWHRIYLMEDVNSKLSFINSNLINLFNQYAPYKTLKTRKTYTPWVDAEIKDIMKSRDHYRLLYRQTNLVSYFERYKYLRNKITNLIRNRKKTFLSSLNSNGNNNKLWKTLNQFNFKNLSGKKEIPEHLNDPQKINNYYIDSVKKLINNGNSDELCQFYSSNRNDMVNKNFSFHLVTRPEVDKCFENIKSNSVGSDKLSLKMLKPIFHFFVKYITHIINFSLMNNVFPDDWKIANVLPLPKVKEPKDFKDLRPVSILPTMSKIFEKIIFSQITGFLNEHRILPSMQSGFRSGYSTSTGLLNVTDDLFRALDKDNITVLITLDYSKAFDTIDHNVLCAKLHYFGFTENAINLIKDYLRGRSQRVVLGSQKSTCENLASGVPQGSVLGPLLFSIYTADFHTHLKSCSYHLYADDTMIYNSFPKDNIVENINKINDDIDAIVSFSKKHQLIINAQKSAMIIFCKKKDRAFVTSNCPVKILEVEIKPSDTIKILGIYLDNELRFKKHVNLLIQKAFGCLKLLYSNKGILDASLRKYLVDALVLSHFNYGDGIYGSCLDQLTQNRVQKLQNSCLRFILGIRRRDHISHAFSELKWLKMVDRRRFHFVCCIHKIIITKLPTYLYSKLLLSANIHSFNTRNQSLLTVPKHNSKLFERSFSYMAAKLYNAVPNQYKLYSLNRFKKEYRDLLLSG